MARKATTRKKRNPADASVEAYVDFHGREPGEFVTITEKVHHHKHLAAAGDLRYLKVITLDETAIVTIDKMGGAILAFNEQRNQLFVRGGNQGVNLKDFGITQAHELETLGTLKDIGYFTRKDHLGDEGGTALYRHTFRTTNENGKHVTVKFARYPQVIYRVRDKQLEFSGGSYVIRAEGIDK